MMQKENVSLPNENTETQQSSAQLAGEAQIHLKETLNKLEKVYSDVYQNQGYTSETEKLKMIVELMREQVSL